MNRILKYSQVIEDLKNKYDIIDTEGITLISTISSSAMANPRIDILEADIMGTDANGKWTDWLLKNLEGTIKIEIRKKIASLSRVIEKVIPGVYNDDAFVKDCQSDYNDTETLS